MYLSSAAMPTFYGLYLSHFEALHNCTAVATDYASVVPLELTLILRRSRTGTVWFYTSTSNKRAARPKLYTKSLTRD